jgi:hypothetical protein
MSAGFGIYNGGRSTAAEERVLRGVPLDAATPDDLTRSATAAVQHLEAAGVLDSPDVTPPLVTAYPAKATLGKPATLHFDLFDDSGRSKAVVRVYESGSPIATLSSPMAFAIGTRHASVTWRCPRS